MYKDGLKTEAGTALETSILTPILSIGLPQTIDSVQHYFSVIESDAGGST
jgi:hypothetical protein